MREINLQDPFQGRRWLNLLVPDHACGFRLKPGFAASAAELGFSCTPNRLGLRGPCDEQAANVIFGTSYALGVGVNDGETWHDLALPASGWLNLGLPVGIREWAELAKLHHRGRKRRALLLYHPNIWAHCLMYERWRASGQDVFHALGWRRDILGCALLSLRQWRRQPRRTQRGEILLFEERGRRYVVDALYARICPEEHRDLIDRNLDLLLTLLRPFEEVWCVRVPVKQELIPAQRRNAMLNETISTYDSLWRRTTEALATLSQGRCEQLGGFVIEDYHGCDTHWNAAGNARFAAWARSSLISSSTSRAMGCSVA